MIAVLMNTLAKGGIAFVTGGWRYAGALFRRGLGGDCLLLRRFGSWSTPLLAPMLPAPEASLAPR